MASDAFPNFLMSKSTIYIIKKKKYLGEAHRFKGGILPN